jgi:hypothetical protein
MTAAIYDPLVELINTSPVERCRFCGCTERNPCSIPITFDETGRQRLARSNAEALERIPCGWYLEEVCNAPACIEKLIQESRVILFDGTGRKLA